MMKESKRIELQISALKQEAAELEAKKTALMEELSQIDVRRKILVAKFGLIDVSIKAYKAAVLAEDDENKPKPVWLVEPVWTSTKKVIDKVTKKRIYLRDLGSDNTSYYEKSTGMYLNCTLDGTLNVEETIKAYELSLPS